MTRTAKSSKNCKKFRSSVLQENILNHSDSSLCDSSVVSETLLDCIKSGDLEAFRDVLTMHIMSTNKVKFAQKTGLCRATLYDLMNRNITFNPSLTTVSAIIRGLGA